MKFLEPVQRVVQYEIAHRPAPRSGVIDRRAPWRVVPLGEEIGRDRVQIIPFRAEMVVHDIEQYRDAARVACIDQRFQFLRAAIARARRKPLHAVIAPIMPPGKFRDRHQFDRGDAELGEAVEMRDRAGEIAGLGECAEMQFIDHDLMPRAAAPPDIAPLIGAGIDHLADSVHAIGLMARRRIGINGAIDAVTVARAWSGLSARQREPAIGLRNHRHGRILRIFQQQRDLLGARRPQPKPHAVGIQLGAEWQLMMAAHRLPPWGRCNRAPPPPALSRSARRPVRD